MQLSSTQYPPTPLMSSPSRNTTRTLRTPGTRLEREAKTVLVTGIAGILYAAACLTIIVGHITALIG